MNYLPSKSALLTNIIDLISYRASQESERLAFSFLSEGQSQEINLSYGQLAFKSNAISSQLASLSATGDRALLLYPPGLDYLTAFFGCIGAGIIAVPAYPPRNRRHNSRIEAIVADASPAIALTTASLLPKVKTLLGKFSDSIEWLTTDDINSESTWQQPSINPEDIAFLQYTSGSTGTPKGVMLSHGNLMHNAAMTYRMMGHSPESKFVSWLPMYHDMGLIGGILQPLYGGFPCILMPPTTFLQNPYSWLQTISQYRGTTSGAPNFAYQLCVDKITPEQKANLDLSSWDVAFNGAEPIRSQTLELFAESFASCGFKKEAFYPCYGMAEATLMISGGRKSSLPATKTFGKQALEQNRVDPNSDGDNYTLVGCGQSLPDQEIAIANPDTLNRCFPGEIGEIWVSGASVGSGYWNRPEQTQEIFNASLSDAKIGGFLRTGDLGCLVDGELFITGRLKDLLIIRGRNLYPQDIELTVENSHSNLRANCGAAFAVEVDGEECLVVVQELEFRVKADLEQVSRDIREAVAKEHEIQPYAVILIKGGTIPKTSSGKIQRRACRDLFFSGKLEVVSSSVFRQDGFELEEVATLNRKGLLAIPSEMRSHSLMADLERRIARILSIPAPLDFSQSLLSLGLDSLKAFELKNSIEADFEVEIAITDLFEGISLNELVEKILNAQNYVNTRNNIVPTGKNTTEHPLSFAQERLWFLDRLETGNPAYNIAFGIRIKGSLDTALLEASLQAVVQRHEALRTSFRTVNGRSLQVVSPTITIKLVSVDLASLSDEEREVNINRISTQESRIGFDLNTPPLIRAKLLHLAATEHILLITLHHIISDGWSVEVLLQEIAQSYQYPEGLAG